MWQIMWLLSFLPNIFWHFLTICGLIAVLSSLILKRIPFISTYRIPLQYGGVLALLLGIWMEGSIANEAKWQAKVKEMEEKVAIAEAKSQEENVKIVTIIAEKTKIVHERGKNIINYIDREVVKDKEVVKFIENCPIPGIIIKTHNAAALNQPIEIPKEPEAAPAEPEVKTTPQVQAEVQQPVIVATATVITWANIRSTKNIKDEKIEKLAPGTRLDVLKLENGYAFVKGNKQGWVGVEFLTVIKKA
jgi:hypothetical protein